MSKVSALIGTIVLIYIPIKSYNIIFQTQNLKSMEFQNRYRIIIMDMRTDNPLRFQFITVFFFRRVIYASIFMFLASRQLLQIGAGLIIVVAMGGYLIIVHPYESPLSSFLSIVNELLLLCLVVIPSRFLDPIITPSDMKMFGNILISLIISTIIINWVAIILYGVVKMIHKKVAIQDKHKPKKVIRKYSTQQTSTKTIICRTESSTNL